MKTKIISFSKPIDNFTTFFLDNGIAILASSILQDGHQVSIEDYGNIDMFEYFVPGEGIKNNIKSINADILNLSRKGREISKAQIGLIRKSIYELKQYQKRRINELAISGAEAAFNENINVVLIKVWNGLGTYYFKKLSEELRKIEKKEKRKIYIYGGGPQVGWFNKHLLEYTPMVDGLIFGEGELSVRRLLKYIDDQNIINDIPGLIYRFNEKIVWNPPEWIDNLNSLPFATYDPTIYKANQENKKIRFISIDPSRGCPNKCYFCNHHHESGDYWRSKKAEVVVDEIKHYVENYNIRYFKYSGSSTPPDLRMHIASELINQNVNIRYITFINTNTVTEKNISLLKESGCFAVFFGIESGSQKILNKSIGTKNSLESIKKAVQIAKDTGLYTVGSLIAPAPYDTNETIQETIEFMLDIKVDASPVLPPGLTGTETEWAKNSKSYQIEKDDEWIEKLMEWDINLNIPSVFWDPLPYKVNGMDFLEFSQITNRVANKLLNHGIPQISDEMALMSRLYGQSENDFVFDTNIELRENDSGKLFNKIKVINNNIQCDEANLI